MGHLTYLLMELAWALPVIAGQWMLGHRTLRARWRLLVVGVLIPTAYLSAADALAIRVGIWSLNPERTLGIWIGGLPLEEGVFFLLTNIMIVQGLLLTADLDALTARLGRQQQVEAGREE
jgi:lycopene cyclase domain-containing protein